MKSVILSLMFFLSISNLNAATITIDDGEDLYVTLDSKDAQFAIDHLWQGVYGCTESNLVELAAEINTGKWSLSDSGMDGAKIVEMDKVELTLWDLGGSQKKVILEKCF